MSTPRIFEFLNLNFGYHVEHHLFPTVNGRHAKAIHHELVDNFRDLQDYAKMESHESAVRDATNL